MHGIREASNDGRMGKVRIIHGLNISHKELTYLFQKSTSHQKPQYYAHAPRGIDWQEKTIARPRPPLIRKAIKKINHAPTSSHNGSPYVHATGITNFNTSISQIHNYSTSTTLISPSLYLKTITKYQTSHSIQHTHKKILLLILNA